MMYKKWVVFGLPGSGKSTFALQLSEHLNIPLYHLDKYFYEDNWKERDPGEFLKIKHQLMDQEKWIIDGNAMKSLPVRFEKTEVALYFRFNRFLCLYRVIKRYMFKNKHIQDRADNCKEVFSFRFIRYLWKFHRRFYPVIQELRKKYPHVQFYEITSDKEANDLLHGL